MSEYVFLKRELDAYPFSFFLLIVSCMVIIALFMAWKDKSTRGIEVSAWILIIVAVMSLFENVGIVLVIPDPPLWLFNVCMIITCIVTALVSSRFLMKSTKTKVGTRGIVVLGIMHFIDFAIMIVTTVECGLETYWT